MAGSFLKKKTLLNGDTRYIATITHKSRNYKTKTFRLRRDAADWAAGFISEIENFAVTGKRKCDVTFYELVNQYHEVWVGADTVRACYVERFKEYFGLKLIDSISATDCREALRPYEQLKPATYNKHKAVLSSLFKFAQQKDLEGGRTYIDHNPVSNIISKPMRNERVRYLSRDEKKRLVKSCRDIGGKFYVAFLLALTTGQRKSNILERRWRDIDLVKGLIDIRETKNDDPILAPIPPIVLSSLGQLAKISKPSELIFSSSVNPDVPAGYRKEWNDARKLADISDFTWHDLRHDVASTLAMEGATIIEIAEILGHRSLQSTKRYAHLSTAHKSELLARTMNGALSELM
jgi:integrase